MLQHFPAGKVLLLCGLLRTRRGSGGPKQFQRVGGERSVSAPRAWCRPTAGGERPLDLGAVISASPDHAARWHQRRSPAVARVGDAAEEAAAGSDLGGAAERRRQVRWHGRPRGERERGRYRPRRWGRWIRGWGDFEQLGGTEIAARFCDDCCGSYLARAPFADWRGATGLARVARLELRRGVGEGHRIPPLLAD